MFVVDDADPVETTMKTLSIFLILGIGVGSVSAEYQSPRWTASWTTALAGPFHEAQFPPPTSPLFTMTARQLGMVSEFALPNDEASDQTFRVIIKPDVWGETIRLRFSNYFGSHDLSLGAANVGLQEFAGHLLTGTNVRITFGGGPGVTIPKGTQIYSDPVHLAFVTPASKVWLRGRNLAVSFEVIGKSGRLSAHGSLVTSYISRPNSGDHTEDNDDSAFPYVTNSFFLINELDVMASADTAVICALGESTTDWGTTTNGYDLWSDDLSRRLHDIYGDSVSVVNAGIGGNTIITEVKGGSEPIVKRLGRDVLSIAGLTTVVWAQGENDLEAGLSAKEILDGYRQVVKRLHARDIHIVGATVIPSLWPDRHFENSPWGIELAKKAGSVELNNRRTELNAVVRSGDVFDLVADMSRAMEDPSTGALYKQLQSGDFIHPNRAGHQAMAAAVDLRTLVHFPPLKARPLRPPETR